MFTKRKFLFFNFARLVFQDKLFLKLVRENRFSLAVLITQSDLDIPSVKKKSKKTVNISLIKKPEEILQNFNDTTRNEVRRTFKIKNLTFKKEERVNDTIFSIYQNFRKSKKLPMQSKRFLESANLYTAYFEGKPISFVTVHDVYPHLRVQNIFSDVSKEGDKEMRKIMGYATRRLIYEICEYGSNKGYKSLDLAGVNLTDSKKQGITKFKMGFGGELADEYTYTYKSPFVNKLLKWKRKLENLR